MGVLQPLQTVAGVAGLVVGAIYIVGGLIVTLHLARYGVTEYQILKVNYLVVGLSYLANSVVIFVLAAIPAVFLLGASFAVYQGLVLSSTLASLWLLWLWGRPIGSRRWRRLRSWYFWIIMGAVSAISPLAIGIRQAVAGQADFYGGVLMAQAVVAGVLAIVAQIYYYARYVYGCESRPFGSQDPAGMGIPTRIQLAGSQDDLSILKHMGIPLLQPQLTEEVLLLDETGSHYIVGIAHQDDVQALKVSKDMIRAILYCGQQ